MSNKIQIKRSVSNTNVTGLSNGELAFTQASNTLFIGLPDGSGVIRIGGAQYPGTLTANQALVANSTSGIDKVIVANAAITSIWANGSSGSNGQVLVTNGTAIYWGTGTSGSNTQVQFNDSGVANGVAGFTFDKTSNTLFVGNTVQANNFSGNGASITSVDAATVGGNTALTLRTYSEDKASNAYSNAMSDTLSRDGSYTADNSFGGTNTVITANLYFSGANAYFANDVYLGSSTNDVVHFNGKVIGNLIPATNNYHTLGNTDLRWNDLHVSNVYASYVSVSGNMAVGGDLTVVGNVTTTNVNSVVVSDPMIYLAGNNYTSDLLDIGFAGNYNDGSTNRHTGLFRDHDDGIWKLFYNLTQELSGNNDVDINDSSYRTATLQAYLRSGGLISNNSAVDITANSTISVNIVANTLSLSTALPGTSGGTGRSTTTNNALLVGNSSNGYNELTLGTSGYVLQSNGTALVYDILDGGTF